MARKKLLGKQSLQSVERLLKLVRSAIARYIPPTRQPSFHTMNSLGLTVKDIAATIDKMKKIGR